jgi:dephospho-CoA kinase
MLLVALTGGIATGKSVVAEILKQLGCYIHEADDVAHQLMEPEKPAWKSLVAHYGSKILNQDKTINRTALGAIIFANKKERLFLNSLLHPLVMERKKQIIKKLRAEGKHKIFISVAALTIEAGFRDFFDKTVVVYCDRETQLKRLVKRDKLTQKEAQKKIKSQLPPEEKLKVADYIINTKGSINQTVEQAEQIYRNLMIDYQLKYFDKRTDPA